jgi:hypothetical protein
VSEPTHYFIDPLAPFPARWRDKIGPLRVLAGPVKGYVMVRRPHAVPFVLHVANLCNAQKHPIHGPFEVIDGAKKKSRAVLDSHKQGGGA